MFPCTVLLFSIYHTPFVAEAVTAPAMQRKSSSVTSPTGGPRAATSVSAQSGLLPCPLRLCQFWFFPPFPTLRKEKRNLRRFLCQKPFSSIHSNCNMKLFAQPLPPGCCLLLIQPATATSSATSSVDEWLHLCFWSQTPIIALSFAHFHSCSLGSGEMKEGGILMFLNLGTYFPVKYTVHWEQFQFRL